MVVIGEDIDQTIQPFEYATIVFSMFGDFLLYNYNKFDKGAFDALLPTLDRQYIERFTFPVSFDEQQYSLDDIEYPVAPIEYGYEWAGLENMVTINPRAEYLKHYSF